MSGLRLVDGDQIVAAADLWPKQKEWWKLPFADDIQRRTCKQVIRIAARNPDLVIVWWTDLNIFYQELAHAPGGKTIKTMGVLIPLYELRRNYDLREAEIKAGTSGHKHGRSWKSVSDGWQKSRKFFELNKIPFKESLERALRDTGCYISEVQLDFVNLKKAPTP